MLSLDMRSPLAGACPSSEEVPPPWFPEDFSSQVASVGPSFAQSMVACNASKIEKGEAIAAPEVSIHGKQESIKLGNNKRIRLLLVFFAGANPCSRAFIVMFCPNLITTPQADIFTRATIGEVVG
jgi:hypothetical protein